MGHIHQQVGSNTVGDIPEFRPIHGSAIGRKATNNHSRLVCLGHRLQLVVVNQTGVMVDAVLHRLINLAGKIDRRAVGQVAPVRQAHTHDRVTGLEQRVINRNIGA